MANRHKFAELLGEVMERNLQTLDSGPFELIKTKARFRFTSEELRDLCRYLGNVIANENTLCKVTEKRDGVRLPVNRNGSNRIFKGKFR